VRVIAGVIGGIALLMVPLTLFWYSGWVAVRGVALSGTMGVFFLYAAWRGESPEWLEGSLRSHKRP
jgi:hypothetical protein